MQIGERHNFDFLLINHCLQRVEWKPDTNQQSYRRQFATCIGLVTRAQVIFRGHLLNPRPGEVQYFASSLDEQ